MRSDLFTCDRCKEVATTGGTPESNETLPTMPEGWMRVNVDVQKLGDVPDAHQMLDLCTDCGTRLLELVKPMREEVG